MEGGGFFFFNGRDLTWLVNYRQNATRGVKYRREGRSQGKDGNEGEGVLGLDALRGWPEAVGVYSVSLRVRSDKPGTEERTLL